MIVSATSNQALCVGSRRKRGTAAISVETLKFRQCGLNRVTPAALEAAGHPGPAIGQLVKSVAPADEDRSTAIAAAFQSLACALHT